ncbi:hypothetical protein [Amycolatopsis sp. NBC_00438]|uniref:hypothetical protein n=1 Tax=Amycolatopsis sp. NBC_00438 TaxID=2903558 RepID=UPI002E1BAA45
MTERKRQPADRRDGVEVRDSGEASADNGGVANTGVMGDVYIGRPSDTAQPFEPLDEYSSAFGNDNTCPYKPTRLEYIQGAIQVRDQLVRNVIEYLRSGVCLLQGRGTVGKTTLALFVGLRHDADGGTTYYLDFTEDALERPNAALALDSMSALASSSILFILDNVHADESLANAMYRHWQRHGAGSQLLLVGRTVSRTTRATIEGSGLARLQSNAVIFDVTEDDLLHTYRRLARISDLNDSDLVPQQATVAAWCQLFASDRIAFVTAVRRHLEGRNPRRWITSGFPLTANDAINYVKEQYLDPYPDARQALAQLAAVSTVEMSMPDDLVSPGVLRSLMAAGVVHATTHGKEFHRRYALTHPGLGHLIAKATRTREIDAVLAELATNSPKFGFALSFRLVLLGRRAEAVEILRKLTSDPKMTTSSLYEKRVTVVIISLVAKLGVMTYKQMDDLLRSEEIPFTLLESAALDLGGAKILLQFLMHRMPMFAKRLAERLAEPDLRAKVADAIPKDLGGATRFLQYAAMHQPQLVDLLRPLLIDRQRLTNLADEIPNNNLGNVAEFLRYAARRLPELARPLGSLLLEEQRLTNLADAILNNLGNATGFLEFVASHLPELECPLVPLLLEEQRLTGLADAIPNNNLGNATRFLDYAAVHQPELLDLLRPLLLEEPRPASLADAIPNHLGNATEFLEFTASHLPELAGLLGPLLLEERRLASLADAIPNNLGNATEFLEFTASHLPELAGLLGPLLLEERRLASLADAIPNNLGNATEFLGYAEVDHTELLDLLRPLLVEERRLTSLADAIPNNLLNATTFLEYANVHQPELIDLLRPSLVEEQRLVRLADAIPNDLGGAARFLEFAHRDIPTLAIEIAELLADPKAISRIVDVAPSSFEGLLSFLQFTFSQMSTVAERVATELADSWHVPLLVERTKAGTRHRNAFYALTELVDLHQPEVARSLWTLLEPNDLS